MPPIHRRTLAGVSMFAVLAAAGCAGLFSGRAHADGLPGTQLVTSVPLPKTGQYQLCLRKTAGQHIGKCNSSPLIHKGSLTVTVDYTGGSTPVITVGECGTLEDNVYGVVITVRDAPLGGELSATVSGKDPVTRNQSATTVGPVDAGEGVVASACMREE